MPEKVFWDTWAFIELAGKDNRFHSVALKIREQLRQQRAMMVVTEAVLTEVGNAFSKKEVRRLAIAQLSIVRAMVQQGTGEIVRVERELWERRGSYISSARIKIGDTQIALVLL